MPKLAKPLTDRQIKGKEGQPRDKEFLLSDGGGLCLLVKPLPDGSKHWVFRYRFGGKERKIALAFRGGSRYPELSLSSARAFAAEHRQTLRSGMDPLAARKSAEVAELQDAVEVEQKQAAAARTFRNVAELWLDDYSVVKQLEQVTKSKIWMRLESAVFPCIGELPIAKVNSDHIELILDRIKKESRTDKAQRVLWICRNVFRFSVRKKWSETDVTFGMEQTLPPVVTGNHAAIIHDLAKVGQLLRDLDAYSGWYAVRFALQLVPLLFVRTDELRLAKWSEFNFEMKLWDIPAERMKGRKHKKVSHRVPLSRQSLGLLLELRSLSGKGEYLFPTPRQQGKPFSNMAMLAALRSLGYKTGEQTIHGFRAMATTLLNERLRIDPPVIEAQLAHAVKDANSTSYNRTQYWEARQLMMQKWADYLDTLKKTSDVCK